MHFVPISVAPSGYQSTLGVGIFCFGLLYDRIEVFYSRFILSTCLTLAFLALALIDVVFPEWIMTLGSFLCVFCSFLPFNSISYRDSTSAGQ